MRVQNKPKNRAKQIVQRDAVHHLKRNRDIKGTRGKGGIRGQGIRDRV